MEVFAQNQSAIHMEITATPMVKQYLIDMEDMVVNILILVHTIH